MIVIFWLEDLTLAAKHEILEEDKLSEALTRCNVLRNEGNFHVSMSVQNSYMVGKHGADSVVDGKLPNGDNYGWKKRRI
jgi:hypothetical protein